DDLLLLRSDDGGATWSAPVTLFRGHFWNCHTSMVIRDRKLYWVLDDLNLRPGRYETPNHADERGPRVIACDLSKDPMNSGAWRISNGVELPEIPKLLIHEKFRDRNSHFLEPNLID